MMMPDDEAFLVAEAREGSSRAFRLLMQKHHVAVRTFLRRFSGDWDEADDLAQEAFAAAWTQLRSFRRESSFRTWVTAIAYRKALMRIRTNKRIAERNSVMEQEEEAMEGSPGLRLDLERALARLSKDRRAVVSLCFGSGFTHEEAAEALGMALGTVKSHALRGREQLKAYFSGEAQ